MLREYQLKNFKAFADAAPLLLRPITLIYGPNSAGKSSIIQSLMLLKQTLEESESPDVVLLPKGKLVDLGNYREMVHLHEIDRQVSIKVQLDTDPDALKSPEDLDDLSDTASRIYKFLYSQIQEFPVLSLELTFSVESMRSDIVLQQVQLWVGQDDCPVITYERTAQGLKVSELHQEHSFWQTWWQEYNLILPNRAFNQINEILKYYNISEISSRDRDNTVEELGARKSSLTEQAESIEAKLKLLEKQKNNLKNQTKDVDQQLMLLKSHQEAIEKPFKDDLDAFLDDLSNHTQLNPIPFLECNQIPADLTKEQIDEFEVAQFMWGQWIQIRDEHYASQRPLLELKSDIEAQVKGTKLREGATQNQANQIHEAIVSIEFLQNFWYDIGNYSQEKAIEDYHKILEGNTLLAVNSFLPFEESTRLPDLESEDSLDIATHFFMGVYEGLDAAQFLFQNTFYMGDLLQLFLRQSVYLGPMRDYPERFYLFSGKSTNKVGKSGKGASDLLFEDSLFLEKVNQSLRNFKIGHEVKISSFKDQETGESADVYAIRLIDEFSKINVSLLDVGFGVSQVLPVIIQSLFSRNQTVLIEQPEVHIHPRLQTELGDLFIESVRDFGNRFIVETHSEHLMLRLQRRIREGKLKPGEVSVLYVDRSEDGSICLQLRLDEEGDFIDHWPDGFFDEDYKEIVG